MDKLFHVKTEAIQRLDMLMTSKQKRGDMEVKLRSGDWGECRKEILR